jgi:hypothetical protein
MELPCEVLKNNDDLMKDESLQMWMPCLWLLVGTGCFIVILRGQKLEQKYYHV